MTNENKKSKQERKDEEWEKYEKIRDPAYEEYSKLCKAKKKYNEDHHTSYSWHEFLIRALTIWFEQGYKKAQEEQKAKAEKLKEEIRNIPDIINFEAEGTDYILLEFDKVIDKIFFPEEEPKKAGGEDDKHN